jgi:hypothetical protein
VARIGAHGHSEAAFEGGAKLIKCLEQIAFTAFVLRDQGSKFARANIQPESMTFLKFKTRNASSIMSAPLTRVGAELVSNLLAEAKRLKIPEVYLETHKPEFYSRLGATVEDPIGADFFLMSFAIS